MTTNRDIVVFRVEGKVITYLDKFWKNGIQIMPLDSLLISKLRHSMDKIMHQYASFIEDANTGNNMEEYKKAKSEEDIIKIIKRDAALNGLTQIGVET